MPGPHSDGELELWLNRAISDTPDEWRRTNRFSSSRIAPATAVQGQKRPSAARGKKTTNIALTLRDTEASADLASLQIFCPRS